MRIIAAILKASAITKILDHLGIPTRAPPRSLAKGFELIEHTLFQAHARIFSDLFMA